ncbi:uncharacterized protein BYT42DRAFT_607716 [Radiomyces spectabilis]|uniref:uncharacterized protein n=1 Tax=Radiomyces spectabilis TaxID=64574 RepID=UPI00221E5669|nr:uncharacterized protein BYT42DRAFT_607716 [Radiomyces spectabilis]KAI8369257.1 hypothetical protein BYT42DRAFT_607716 [Radiomyces spectabilis]
MSGLRALRDFYNRSYNKRPILTLCVTNGILGVFSDGLAQTITYYEAKSEQGRNKLDKHLPDKLKEHEDLWPPTPKYDITRTLRFAAYNFCVAPLAGKWYMFLDKFFPMPVASTVASKAAQIAVKRQGDKMAIKRMVTDQALFAPAGLVVFFTAMGFAETRKWEGVKEKFEDAFVPALITNYKVWPLVQFINFKFMPLQYRLPFVSSLGILWNAYLSWLNNASKQEEYVKEHITNPDSQTQKEQVLKT